MNKTYGQIAYEAYCNSVNWVSVSGHQLPPWADMRMSLQQAWNEGADAAIHQYEKDCGG